MKITVFFEDADEDAFDSIHAQLLESNITVYSEYSDELKLPSFDEFTISLEIAGALTALVGILKAYLTKNRSKKIKIKHSDGSFYEFHGHSPKEIEKLSYLINICNNFENKKNEKEKQKKEKTC
jgi:hypothetical protein